MPRATTLRPPRPPIGLGRALAAIALKRPDLVAYVGPMSHWLECDCVREELMDGVYVRCLGLCDLVDGPPALRWGCLNSQGVKE